MGATRERLPTSVGRLLAVMMFIIAQALFATHAGAAPDQLQSHSAAECAYCLAGAASDDPVALAPVISAPALRLGMAQVPIPAALLTEIAVRAASPRAPPLL
ncbi:MAG: hypothetical protein ACKVS5_03355 [Parvularculaceae bacterium]